MPSHEPHGQARASSAFLHAVFFATGFVALAHEVLWMRRLVALFGATGPAAAATLSAVFLGLALGSAVVAPRAAEWSRPLRAFGLLEIGVGLSALAVPHLLALWAPLQAVLHPLVAGSTALSLLAKTTVAALAVLVPTALMGATLPVLAQALAPGGQRLGIGAGGLYAVNTAGAAAGALAVPMALLPLGGVGGATAAACAVNVACGAAVLVAQSPAPAKAAPRAPASSPLTAPGAALAVMAFLSGALALGLQVLGTRVLAQVHDNSVAGFSVVLAVFLAGLTAGAAAARALLRSGARATALVATGWIGAGACAVTAPRLVVWLTDGLRYLPHDAGARTQLASVAGVAVASLLPATLLLGLVLPSLMDLAGERTEAPPARTLGRLLALNLAGCIAGPLVVGFWLVPRAGVWWSLALVGAAMALAGAWSLRGAGARFGLVAALVMTVAAVAPGRLPRVHLAQGERLVSLRDGALGTVAVVDDGTSRRMKLNNAYTLGGTLSAGDERMQAHLPLLLHPRPLRVAFLGLGTGITAGAALAHPVERVLAVELVPEVVAASAEFEAENAALARDPRVELAVDDARTRLTASTERFDVIVGDLFVPWRPGEGAMYSAEQFRAAREALAPGGVFCQWVPAFQASRRDFMIIAATFVRVFPDATLWRGDFNPGEPALALIATPGARIDPAVVAARVRGLPAGADPSNPFLVDPSGVWAHLVGALDAGLVELASSRVNTDAWPLLELASPLRRVDPRPDDATAFVGAPLTAFLETVRARPLAGSALARLGPEHLAWRDAGASLWQAALHVLERRPAAADALARAALASLPAAVQVAVTGEVVGVPAEREPVR